MGERTEWGAIWSFPGEAVRPGPAGRIPLKLPSAAVACSDLSAEPCRVGQDRIGLANLDHRRPNADLSAVPSPRLGWRVELRRYPDRGSTVDSDQLVPADDEPP
jgi:hypothetical protein